MHKNTDKYVHKFLTTEDRLEMKMKVALNSEGLISLHH
jgi:hypothetical protein